MGNAARLLRLLSLLCVLLYPAALAAEAGDTTPSRFVADIELQSDTQFLELLERAEQLLLAGVPLPAEEAQVTFVLHGPVLKSLLRDNYLDNKRLVDLAASLSALAVIEVKACRTWMTANGLDSEQLQPFVDEVSYGPGLVERLVNEESYLYF